MQPDPFDLDLFLERNLVHLMGLSLPGLMAAYSARTHVAPGDLGTAADQNQGMDNEEYLKSEHDLATPTDLNAGWRKSADTWVYASGTSFTISAVDRTSIYQKGTRIRWKDGGAYKYAVVVSSAFSTNTTVTFTGGTDYSMANATITDNYYSYEESPQGYPHWFNYTPSFTGFSATPSVTLSKFRVVGRKCQIAHSHVPGTSNATGFTISLPITAITIANASWNGALGVTWNGGVYVATGSWEILSAATVATLYTTAHGAWTGSSTKAGYFVAEYEI